MRGFHGAVKQTGLLLEGLAKGLQEGLCFVSLARKKGLRKNGKKSSPKEGSENERASGEAKLGQSTSLQRLGVQRSLGPREDRTQT